MRIKILQIVILVFIASAFPETHRIRFCCIDAGVGPIKTFSARVGDTIEWRGLFELYPLRSTVVPAGAKDFSTVSGIVYRYVPRVPGNYQYKCDISHAKDLKGDFTVVPAEALLFGSR